MLCLRTFIAALCPCPPLVAPDRIAKKKTKRKLPVLMLGQTGSPVPNSHHQALKKKLHKSTGMWVLSGQDEVVSSHAGSRHALDIRRKGL